MNFPFISDIPINFKYFVEWRVEKDVEECDGMIFKLILTGSLYPMCCDVGRTNVEGC